MFEQHGIVAISATMPSLLEKSPEESLYDLLVELHGEDGEGLLRFLQFGENGDDVAAHLPSRESSTAQIAGQAVSVLKRRGLIGPVFFERLRQRFPRREPDIRIVCERWITTISEFSTLSKLPPDSIDAQQFYQQQLNDAQRRKRTLLEAGQSAAVVEAEIKVVKRQLRQGNAPSQGDLLAGRYWLLERVGAGGFGTVWRARDQTDESFIAIKILHPRESQDASKRARFFRGARAMRRLDHPAIVRIREPEYSEADTHFFVMEYIDGQNLERAILEHRLSSSQIFGIVVAIGRALAHAHAAGMVHRDVKPSNILLDAAGNPRLTDFDLVLADDTTGGTRQGGMGTFVYSAPEMYQDANLADHRADVFGLAMTSIFCLLGERLPLEVLRHEDRVFARLATSSRVKIVLRKAIEWSPGKRHQTMAEFCAELIAAARYRQAGMVELLVLGGLAVALILVLVLPGQSEETPEPAVDASAKTLVKPETRAPTTITRSTAKSDVRLPAAIERTLEKNVVNSHEVELTETDPPPPTVPESLAHRPEVTSKRPNKQPSKLQTTSTRVTNIDTPAVQKSIYLSTAVSEELARECEERRAPGAGCSGTVATVHLTLGVNGVISGAKSSGFGSERELGQCIASMLLRDSYVAEANGDREFTCE